jgi:hypothetical protein
MSFYCLLITASDHWLTVKRLLSFSKLSPPSSCYFYDSSVSLKLCPLQFSFSNCNRSVSLSWLSSIFLFLIATLLFFLCALFEHKELLGEEDFFTSHSMSIFHKYRATLNVWNMIRIWKDIGKLKGWTVVYSELLPCFFPRNRTLNLFRHPPVHVPSHDSGKSSFCLSFEERISLV